ncbi:MAG TPA: long-chain fatty acid--CoA ligase [Jatrophihabitantaceae bacterium]|nr:long-chain fatty acid--CoA ligase [Jatrophihabitantaceae bacterium]
MTSVGMGALADGAVDDDAEPVAGLMMDIPLTVHLILDRMRAVHGATQVVSAVGGSGADLELRRATFTEVLDRAEQLASALARLGVLPGQRVASFAWNTQEHLETYYAVSGMGAVLHTINLRLHPDQIVFTINHARDRVVIVDSSLATDLWEVRARLTTVEHVIVIGDPGPWGATALDYETLLAAEEPGFPWPAIDERSAISLCYTSGTTGDPKGVLYSHRSVVLHALSMSGGDVFGIFEDDVVLALVPLFHVMGWGLPFVCGLIGAQIVLPGRQPNTATTACLIGSQRVTWSAGVPTVWMDLLRAAGTGGAGAVDVSSLRTVLCGGTTVPESMMRGYHELGVNIVQGWGMTELFPGAAVVRRAAMTDTPAGWARRTSAGRISPLYQMRVVDEDGAVLPAGSGAVGELEVRGPIVASSYLGPPDVSPQSFRDGWLRTGDVGTIDQDGWLRITDRLKDVIKSGGEWISSLDLESALMGHPDVREAAVVARPDERWGERPVAFVVLEDDAGSAEGLEEFLRERVAKWWIPDDFVVIDSIPRTSTGKFDKKRLKAQFAEGS